MNKTKTESWQKFPFFQNPKTSLSFNLKNLFVFTFQRHFTKKKTPRTLREKMRKNISLLVHFAAGAKASRRNFYSILFRENRTFNGGWVLVCVCVMFSNLSQNPKARLGTCRHTHTHTWAERADSQPERLCKNLNNWLFILLFERWASYASSARFRPHKYTRACVGVRVCGCGSWVYHTQVIFFWQENCSSR